MDVADFSEDSPGTLVQVKNGHAFVPDPPPRGLHISPRTVRLLGKAHAALGSLTAAGKQLPNPDLFVAPFRKQEAVLSSRIEGSDVSLDDAFAEEVSPTTGKDDQHREILNYELALHQGIRGLAEGRPLNLSMIKGLHVQLLKSARGAISKPGTLKTEQNFLGYSDNIAEARFVPPPPLQTLDCLEALDSFLQVDPDEEDDPLIRAALAHYQFETIHPFIDGNGRIGRLLIPLQLINEQVMDRPWLFLSPFVEKRRQAYYDSLLAVSMKAEWEAWIVFFLTGVESVATSTTKKMHALQELCTGMEQKIMAHTNSANPLALVRLLQEYPYLTVDRAQQHLGGPRGTASHAVKTLEKLGVVRKSGTLGRSGRGRNPDFYFSEEIFNLISN